MKRSCPRGEPVAADPCSLSNEKGVILEHCEPDNRASLPNSRRRERREGEMSLNIISARSAPIAFACLALFPGISTPASADYVTFPGAEWSQGSLGVDDQSLPFKTGHLKDHRRPCSFPVSAGQQSYLDR